MGSAQKGLPTDKVQRDSPRECSGRKRHQISKLSLSILCKTNYGFLSKSYLQSNYKDPISPAQELQRQQEARAANPYDRGIKWMGKLLCQSQTTAPVLCSRKVRQAPEGHKATGLFGF